MRRREFIAGLAGAAAWPVAARAQQRSSMPVVGFLNGNSSEAGAPLLAAFRQGLREERYVDGENVTILSRWADNQYDRLPALAMELVTRRVAVIAAGTPPAAQAAKAATSTIPIVFTTGIDAIRLGLVSSLSRPEGNITGISSLISTLTTKQLELLHYQVPQAPLIAVLLNPDYPDVPGKVKETLDAARAVGLQLQVIAANTERDIDAAFTRMTELQVGALVVFSDPFFFSRREKIVALAAAKTLPAIYDLREFATAGGLMSYGPSITDSYRQAGVYVGRVLKGTKPGDLPVLQPTTFDFVINLKTAKALGTQHGQCRQARHCRPAGVEGHITRKRIASEAGRSRV
jgi:putative ABC transport system substrate-binding protein